MCFWSRSTIEYSAVNWQNPHACGAGTNGQRYGCGKLLPEPNRITWVMVEWDILRTRNPGPINHRIKHNPPYRDPTVLVPPRS